MAAVSLLPSPKPPLLDMTSRRVPLGNLPNAANSPFRDRGAATTQGSKRARTLAENPKELAYAQQPPAKKVVVEESDQGALRHAQLRKAGYNPPTGLQKKLEAASRERTQHKASDNLDTIRQWQRHYKKVFPSIVFYYESIPDDARAKISRQVQALGSREEAFFSKTVTHVVTTRSIPPELLPVSSAGGKSPIGRDVHTSTINPLLLDTQQARGRFSFEAPMPKRNSAAAQALAPSDILYKAREMKIKIWPLEKLNRMLSTMFNNDTGEAPLLSQITRFASTASTAGPREADLSQLLQKEKQFGRAKQEWSSDLAPFRGYYIYIHDMDEETRPVMIRDYPKPVTKEQGKWPQLRPNAPGRCPFLNDPLPREQAERSAERAVAVQAPRTRAVTAAQQGRSAAPVDQPNQNALTENNNLARRSRGIVVNYADEHVKPLDPPKAPIKRGTSTDNLPLFGSAQASLRHHPRFAGGEPVASGVQSSNITSAIRSQMISSTAAAPGAKTGTTKVLNRLTRQVLERNNGPSTRSCLDNIRAAIGNDGPVLRGAKRKIQDSLAHIREEDMQSEGEERGKRVAAPRKKKSVEKEMKPGYCENCRVKFNDFDEHIVSKVHRKFATSTENWTELDDLLKQLVRPRKDDE